MGKKARKSAPSELILTSDGKCPDLDGYLVKLPRQSRVWLIDNGVRRHVTAEVMADIFIPNAEIEERFDSCNVVEGRPFPYGTVLIQAVGERSVHLIDDDDQGVRRRQIMNGATFNFYQFSAKKIVRVPLLVKQGVKERGAIQM